MKNNHLITDLGPHLLVDYSLHRPSRSWGSWIVGLALWVATLGTLCWLGLAAAHAESETSDPMVMKIYPDGTKVILPWSEVGKKVDDGEKHGGAPRIVSYDPLKEGIVPIGEPSQKPETTSTNAAIPASSSVVSPEPSPKMDYKDANPDTFDEQGPLEGFGFRTSVGAAFQQSASYRSSNGANYNTVTFNPGIRFDLEPFYNITDWFAVGVETAFIYNTIHSQSNNGDFQYQGNPSLGNGAFYQVPILANVRFQFPSDGPWKGYVGGGVGGAWDFLTVATRHSDTQEPYPYTSYQWNYVFQLTTGFTYTIARGFDLEGAFKTLCTPNPVRENGDGQIKASYNYAAQIGLVWRF